MSKSIKTKSTISNQSEELQQLVDLKRQVVTFFKDEKIIKFTAQGACYQSKGSITSCTNYMADLKAQLTELHDSGDTNNIRIPRLVELYQDAEMQLELHEIRHQADCIVFEEVTGEQFKMNNTKTVNADAVNRILGK